MRQALGPIWGFDGSNLPEERPPRGSCDREEDDQMAFSMAGESRSGKGSAYRLDVVERMASTQHSNPDCMIPGFLSNCMSPVLDPLHIRYDRRMIAPSGMHSSHIIAKDHRALLSQPHGHLPQSNICSAFIKSQLSSANGQAEGDTHSPAILCHT